MKTTRRCPKCSGTRIGVIEGVYDDWTVDLPAELAARFMKKKVAAEAKPAGYRDDASGEASPRPPRATTKSKLERTAYLCGSCGYYETYLSHPELVETAGREGGLRWLD